MNEQGADAVLKPGVKPRERPLFALEVAALLSQAFEVPRTLGARI